MTRTRKVLGLTLVSAMVGALLTLMAAPASATAGVWVELMSPTESGSDTTLSSQSGILEHFTAVSYSSDDKQGANRADFFYRDSSGNTPGWQFIGSDFTPTAGEAGSLDFQRRGAVPVSNQENEGRLPLEAWEVEFNTAGWPSTVDVAVVVCGLGFVSNAVGAAPGTTGTQADNNFSGGPPGVIALTPDIPDCAGDLGTTLGTDVHEDVPVVNSAPAVRIADFPSNGHHGDALSTTGFTILVQTSLDAVDVCVGVMDGPIPSLNPAGHGTIDFPAQGSGDCPAAGGGAGNVFGAASALPGPPAGMWTITFGPGAGQVPLLPGAFVAGQGVRIAAAADDVPNGISDGNIAGGASTGYDSHYAYLAAPSHFVTQARLVWDYQAGPGNRSCLTGASAASSQIDPWRLTDADGDGNEGLNGPNSGLGQAGFLDVNDIDNPVLKACFRGADGQGLNGVQIAWEIVSGPGGIDADDCTYRDDLNLAGFLPNSCASDGGTNGPVAGGYNRVGSVYDPPLGGAVAGTSRVCGTAPCQTADYTSIIRSDTGVDLATVNSLKTGVTTYRACVDLDGSETCNSNAELALSATATMDWGAGGRNHNHVWQDGTEATDGHSGVSTVAAPAGSTVDIVGFVHDNGHNAVRNVPVIWRIGTNAPGHFVGPIQSTSDAAGQARVTIGSSVLDAARTTSVFFCGDTDFDGICDDLAAEFEVNWGGIVTETEFVSFSLAPSAGVFGTEFLASGTLLDLGGLGVSSAAISVECRVLGDTDFEEVATAVSNIVGDFSAWVEPTFSSDCRAVFPGNVSYNGTTSSTDRAWVRVGIAMNASDTTLLAGETVRISGRVLPAHPGAVVTLQQLDNGRGWVNIASTRLSAASTYAFTVNHGVSKSLLFRVTFPTQTLVNAWNVSRALRVTWS